MIHATPSVATERIAEELAREALKDDTFRRMFREMVRQRSQAILDRLLANGGGRKRPRRMRPR